MLRLNQQTVRNMIDRGELGAVRVGQRRVRVRQSQLDAFLAAGELTHETGPSTAAGPDEDPWHRLREAASALADAARAEDRAAVEQALSAVTTAARGL
jgi:excisionase family DNA binding protein